MSEQRSDWIPDLEIENAQIKWAFSHFDGREDTFNAEGDHNFQIIIPNDSVDELLSQGWSLREMPPYEEGDPPEWLLKVRISYKYEDPKIFFIKGDRKMRADRKDLADIKRSTCEQMDVIISPSRWSRPNGESGVSAYLKEMYCVIKESRFSERYADFEEV